MPETNTAVREATDAIFSSLPIDGRQAVVGDLLATAGLLSREPRLRAALTDPSVPPEAKRTLLDPLIGDRVASGTVPVVVAIVEHQRLRSREIVDVIEDVASQAALDLAEARGTLSDVEDELFRFGRLVDRVPELRSALTDPAIGGHRKRELLEDLLDRKADPLSVMLLGHLVEQDRSRELSRVVGGMLEGAARRRDASVAEVRTAVALDDDRRGRLAAVLEQVTGRRVQLRVVVDPGVVGSLAVRIGDEVYDGTVRRQLELMRERLGVG